MTVARPVELVGAVSAASRARGDAAVELAGRLVATPSDNPGEGEADVMLLLTSVLREHGIVRSRELARDRNRPNVLFTVEGAHPGPSFMLIGHADTRPAGEPSAWTSDPLAGTVSRGRLYGLGASDMKGALAAMVEALGVLRHFESELHGTVKLAVLVDEEAGSQEGAALVAGVAGWNADVGLIGEPAGIRRDWEAIHVASRGSCCFTVRVSGDEGHSGLAEVLGLRNASTAMARLLTCVARDFRVSHPSSRLYGRPTINAGVRVRGGRGWGIIPGSAEFDVEVRLVPGMDERALRREAAEFIQRAAEAQAIDAELIWPARGTRWSPATAAIPPDHSLVDTVRSACDVVLHHAPPLGGYPAGTDAQWFAAAGMPVIAAFGPGLISVAHRPDEWVNVKAIRHAVEIYALTALGFLGPREVVGRA